MSTRRVRAHASPPHTLTQPLTLASTTRPEPALTVQAALRSGGCQLLCAHSGANKRKASAILLRRDLSAPSLAFVRRAFDAEAGYARGARLPGRVRSFARGGWGEVFVRANRHRLRAAA